MLIRALILAAVVCVATGCTRPGDTRTDRQGAALTLGVGDRVPLPDHNVLRFVAVREDSRCRPDVTCIHAGHAQLDFSLVARDGVPRLLTLTYPDQASGRLGAWVLAVDSLDFAKPPRVTVRLRAG